MLPAIGQKLAVDCSAAVAPVVAILIAVLCLCVGGAVDCGRWLSARTQTEAAVDAAVMAGGRMLQIVPGARAEAVASARQYYLQNIEHRGPVLDDSIEFMVLDSNVFSAKGNAWMATPFLALAGIDRLPLLALTPFLKSTSDSSGGGGSIVRHEIALMLDTSASTTPARLADLKAAALDFVDIVVNDDATARVALVPFSSSVNLGFLAASVHGRAALGTCETPGCEKLIFWRGGQPGCAGGSGGIAATGGQRAPCTTATFSIDTCVSERTGVDAYTDAPPARAPVGRHYASSGGSCRTASPITPLTADRTALKSAITALAAGGRSAGHLGTAWAWYLLSPEWAYLLPDESKPASYADLDVRLPGGRPRLSKIVVMVTDGAYDIQHCHGVDDRLIACASPNGNASSQARRLCAVMKSKGVLVYAIELAGGDNGGARETLRDHCASDADMFYAVADGQQLRQAWRDIALRISTLRTTQ